MAFDKNQLENSIIRPALAAIGLLSENAVSLLLGTCAQESNFGTYVAQTNTPNFTGGLGIYQIQQPSYHIIWNDFVNCSPSMKAKIRLYLGYDGMPPMYRLVTDLGLATIMTRLFYFSINEPLPQAWNIPAMAAYWKKYYNTDKGKGTEQEFIDNFNKYVTNAYQDHQ